MADLGDSVRTSWHRFLDTYEPLRPDLLSNVKSKISQLSLAKSEVVCSASKSARSRASAHVV